MGCSGWGRAGHPSLSCHCPSQPIACPRGWALCLQQEQPHSPAWQLPCPWEAAQLSSSSSFAGSGILQGLLRGSPALGTGDTANTGGGALPARHHAAVGFICFTAADHSCPSYFSVCMTAIGPTLPLLLRKKNAINTHYNLHKNFQQPRLKSVFMCLEFI